MRVARFAAATALLALPVGMLGASAVSASAQHGATAHQGVNDFPFASFYADHSLATDANGRSSVKTAETFAVQFPDFDPVPGRADGALDCPRS